MWSSLRRRPLRITLFCLVIMAVLGCGANPPVARIAPSEQPQASSQTIDFTDQISADNSNPLLLPTELVTFEVNPNPTVPVLSAKALSTLDTGSHPNCFPQHLCRIKVRQVADLGKSYLTFVAIQRTAQGSTTALRAWYGHGSYDIWWDGKDENGNDIKPGDYNIVLEKIANGYRTSSLHAKGGLAGWIEILLSPATITDAVILSIAALIGLGLIELAEAHYHKADEKDPPRLVMTIKYCGVDVYTNNKIDIDVSKVTDLVPNNNRFFQRYKVTFYVVPNGDQQFDLIGPTKHLTASHSQRNPIEPGSHYTVILTDSSGIKRVGNALTVYVPPTMRYPDYVQIVAYIFRSVSTFIGSYGDVSYLDYAATITSASLIELRSGAAFGTCSAY